MILQEMADFVTVLLVTVGVSGLVASLYACGLRLWSAQDSTSNDGSCSLRRAGSIACFVACAFVVLFALWLMIPVFH
ncbi:MAG: hypothetical protein Q4B69_00620 [Slackia sp.]|nr:hypothetical protein [Slackia sp.]